ncbi:hypothetical protein OKW43_008445 [Paraburkholderia sp. WC7.3g]|uniref:Uncharacterized protein n=1 Tax=Paraburkholderia podalyriae TaxID=1938811 RepID=A0ABR7PZ83_9BURK|nr:hypothetical protein [Paraburkholderia podalyriae]MBC8751601.1 hypothetical protein [Paraburkholderia podalyriae]
MSAPLRRYAVGRWGSLWASQPYMSHRILIDLPARKVIAGEHRFCKEWRYMSVRDLECMQQELNEMFDDIFDKPQEYDFEVIDEPPYWALFPRPWPGVPALTDVHCVASTA